MRYAYLGDSGYIPEMKWRLMDWTTEKLEFEMDFSMKLIRFLFRSVRQPVPEIKQNRNDAYGAAFLTAIDAGSYSGFQALIYANRNEAKPLNGWVHVPQLERTQSLASFEMKIQCLEAIYYRLIFYLSLDLWPNQNGTILEQPICYCHYMSTTT